MPRCGVSGIQHLDILFVRTHSAGKVPSTIVTLDGKKTIPAL
jgi:hypothetical protein